MATANKAADASKSAPKADTPAEDKPKRVTFRAEQYLDLAVDLVTKAGDAGLSVKDLGSAIKAEIQKAGTTIEDSHAYRIAHNVGWHLEGQPVYRAADDEHGKVTRPDKRKVRRLPGSSIRYVLGAGKLGDDYQVTKKAASESRKASTSTKAA